MKIMMQYRRVSMTQLSLYDLETYSKNESNKEIKSILEDLSNELLIEIVQRLSSYDLHRGLYNLNFRLNRICEIQKLQVDLSRTKRAFEYYCSHQQAYTSQVYSLKLDDTYDRLIQFNQSVRIEDFLNLRMLTIRGSSSENLNTIVSNLHRLPHLSYLNIQWSSIQTSAILTNIFQIRSLNSLIFFFNDPMEFDFSHESIKPFTQLEYLCINSCCLTEFLELLKYTGPNVNLIKIRFKYLSRRQMSTINSSNIDQLLLNPNIPVNLRRLDLKFYFLSLTHLHLILRLFPHLLHLTFTTLTDELDYISPSIWYEFLSTHLLELKQLQFYIEIKGLLGATIPCPSTELIDTLYSMNRQWFNGPIVMDYNYLLKSPIIEVYTYPQSARIGKYSLEYHGKTRYITAYSTEIPMNVDKNITDLRITLTNNQQMTTTTMNQFSLNETEATYPKVTRIILHSELVQTLSDEGQQSIIPSLLTTIPDLSKITTLSLTINSTIQSIHPQNTLVRRLLDKCPKLDRLELCYDYLLYLLRSPLIVQLLSRKIQSLSIVFDTNPPKLPDILRILKIFGKKLYSLNFDIRMNFVSKELYFILPPIFSELCSKLSLFRFRLYPKSIEQMQVFDESFKIKLKNCLMAQVQRNSTKARSMEYKIKDNELSVSF